MADSVFADSKFKIKYENKVQFLPKGGSELFVDDFRIASRTNVVRRIIKASKLSAPVVVADMPWELGEKYDGKYDRRLYIYGSVIKDQEKDGFRMWYNRYNRNYYATSDDGIHWDKPRLGLLGDNNMIDFHDFHCPSIILDSKEPDARKRYKAIGSTKSGGYKSAFSSNGLEWTLYSPSAVLLSNDTIALAQDPKTSEYLAFHKRSRDPRVVGRQVFLSVSRDMQTWSDPHPVMVTDETDHEEARKLKGGTHSEFYTMSAFPYGNQWLGFVTHFRRTGAPKVLKPPFQSPHEGPIDVQLVHSRDGRIWHRFIDRTPIIPTGPHKYDSGSILGLCNSPVIFNNEVWMYYTAMTTPHGGYLPDKEMSIARASWKLDRLVSLKAGETKGIVETRPIMIDGTQLEVNYELAKDGMFCVEVLDEKGNVIQGFDQASFRVTKDSGLFKQVGWNSSILPQGIPIRLRFLLTKGDLYSYAIK